MIDKLGVKPNSNLLCYSITGGADVATSKLAADESGLSKEQLDLIQNFEADFNTVDHFLRKDLGSDRQVAFTRLVYEYSERHAAWRDAELLRTTAEIRNAIVHGKTEPYRYVAIPTPMIARQLRKCRDRLMNPTRAFPRFQRTIEKVSIHDTLAKVLKIIHQTDYSQFPVYEEMRFRGLLTENGVTRWLAHHVVRTFSLVELDDISVGHVLQNEEKRKNYHFVSRDMRVDDVSALFAKEVLLEAALVTVSGKETETLLGIATRWDILRLT